MKRIYNLIITLTVLFVLPNNLYSQLTISIEEACPVPTGEEICIDVQVDGFIDIIGAQFTIGYDPGALEYTTATGFNMPGMTISNFGSVTPGEIVFSWLDNTFNGVTLPSPTTIFEVCFNQINDQVYSEITVINSMVPIEFINTDETLLIPEINGGYVGCNFDLATRMTLESGNINPGGDATFKIEIHNQGDYEATSVEITNYIPNGLLLNDANWTLSDNLATLTTGAILPGESQDFFINFTIDENFQCGSLFTYSEISDYTHNIATEEQVPDVDSTPDQDNTNDAGGQPESSADDYINGDGTGNIGDGLPLTDEDDHDGVKITLDANPDALSVTIDQTFTEPDCEFVQVTLEAETSGGSGDYTYQWSHGLGEGAVKTFTVSTTTNYYVTVTDNIGGCTKIAEHNVAVGPPLTLFCIPTPTSCAGGWDGCIEAVVTGGVAPYEFLWSNGQIGNPICGLSAGIYFVTVVDALGCEQISQAVIEEGEPLQVSIIANPITICEGETSDLSVELPVEGELVTYFWAPAASISDPTGANVTASPLVTTQYEVQVTNFNGCFATASTTIFVEETPEPEALNITTCISAPAFELSVGYPNTVFSGAGVTNNFFSPIEANLGAHLINYEIFYGEDCTFEGTITIEVTEDQCNLLHGKMVIDEGNCIAEIEEQGLSGWFIKIESDEHLYYAVTDEEGFYSLSVIPDVYTVSAILPNNYSWNNCNQTYEADLSTAFDLELNIPIIAFEDCPYMTVDVGTNALVRCFSSYHWVNYCNEGTALAEDVQIVIELDPFLNYQSSQIPTSSQDGNTLTFDLGDVDINECGSFWINLEVSCEAVLGQTHCIEARIFPDELCEPINPLWSQASIALDAECQSDSLRFFIRNEGDGDMLQAREFIVVEDGVMLLTMPDEVILGSGEEYSVAFATDGKTRRLEIPQVAYHPGTSMPSITIEGCGEDESGNFSIGFVTQFDTDDYNDFIDIDCRENIGAYDPNDKLANPKGFGEQHYLYPNTDIEYTIRFQNTGTAPAQNVIIRDTLSPWLDITSVRPNVSSHPYTFNIDSANVLVFNFENIMLPDSNANEAASHGFIKYRISQIDDVPLLTEIDNSAAIYFDFNEPVITNTVQHIINVDFLDVVNSLLPVPEYQVEVFPNPASETIIITTDENSNTKKRVLFFDPRGRKVMEDSFIGSQKSVNTKHLPEGIYFYQLEMDNLILGRGKIVVSRK